MAEYRIYKPNKANNGAATAIQFRIDPALQYDKTLIFIQSAKQTGIDGNGNASFGWKDAKTSVSFKVEETDIGELLCVLNGIKDGVGGDMGLFHKNNSGNTSLQFKRLDQGYGFRLAKKGNDGVLVECKHMITFAEGEILRVFLAKALELKVGF